MSTADCAAILSGTTFAPHERCMSCSNIELKARCPDLQIMRNRAIRAGAKPAAILHQTDTYFHCTSGRLKLREINNERAELIAYHRDDHPESRKSEYSVIPVPDPASLKAALQATLGIRGQVIKRRELWLWRNVRIHLDDVQGLGTFMEFEAVVSERFDEAASKSNLEEIRGLLQIPDSDLIAVSYSDLLAL